MLNDRELATVLAALRHWQENTDIVERAINDIASPPDQAWAAAGGALNDDEIDALCERLNTEFVEPQLIAERAGWVIEEDSAEEGTFHASTETGTYIFGPWREDQEPPAGSVYSWRSGSKGTPSGLFLATGGPLGSGVQYRLATMKRKG